MENFLRTCTAGDFLPKFSPILYQAVNGLVRDFYFQRYFPCYYSFSSVLMSFANVSMGYEYIITCATTLL